MTVDSGQPSALARLEQWYRSPLGAETARAECASVQGLLANTFGYYLVQIGMTERFDEILATSRIRHCIKVPGEQVAGLGGASIIGLASALPIASDSIDAVVLPHVLDFAETPQAVLGEVERVLIPEGRVIVVGFNALSAWGLRRLLWRSKDRVPWCGQFHSTARMTEWLAEFGFDIETHESLMFCPPFGAMLGPRCGRLDRLGKRFWPVFGGIYVIRAVKRVATLTPLKPMRGSPSTLLTGRTVRPTTRGTGHV